MPEGMAAFAARGGGKQRRRRAFLLLSLTTCIVVPTTPFAMPGARASTSAALHSTAATATGRLPASPKDELDQGDDRWKDGEYGNSTSLASKLLFGYADPLLDLASKRRLESSDAFNVPERNSMQRAVSRLQGIYTKCRDKARGRLQKIQSKTIDEGEKSKGSKISESTVLAKALLQSQKETLVYTGALRLLNTIVQAFPALIIARLLLQIEGGNSISPIKPLRSALLLVCVLSVKMVVENQYFHNVVKCACEVRGSLSGVIFDKSLRLSSTGGGGDATAVAITDDKKKKRRNKSAAIGSGGVLNLMQSDAATIEALTLQLHTIWDGLLQITIYSALLYKYLGPPFIYGVSVLLATIPINAMTLRILNRLSMKETEAKDARMKKTTESIANMQLLKLQNWEGLFADDVQKYREKELQRHTRRGAVRALNQAISNTVPTITLVVTLVAYAKTGRPIVASTIFTAISLFNQLRFPLFFYPMLIDSMANGRNSLRRISNYLAQEEITPYVEYRPKNGGGAIEMVNGNFAWSAGSETDGGVTALCNASISVSPGEIVAVVGEVGSGKSALCKSLIGELAPVGRGHTTQQVSDGTSHTSEDTPRVIANGDIAYCSQEAWLPKGTIRDSVLFGREYDEKRYMKAIYSAGLDDDISSGVLTHETDVGEGGSSLSGGQRARVALARALYDGESSGVYILDDPLSALDANVGSTVFERLSAKLRKEKAATLFVTNDPNLPRRCDKVILMRSSSDPTQGSRIIAVGTCNELRSQGYDINTICHHEVEDANKEDAEGEYDFGGDVLTHLPFSTDNATISDCHADVDCKDALQQDPALLGEHLIPQQIEPAQESIRKRQKQLSADDTMSTGAVPRSIYMKYFRSVRSPVLIFAALASYFVSNGSQFVQQMVVARWTEDATAMAAGAGAKYLNKLVLAAGMVSVSMYFRSYLTMRVGVRASKSLHQRMLQSVFRAPLSFFSATPSGQLITRFGKELDVVDRALPDGLASVLYCFLQIFFSVAALAGVVTPLMAIPLMLVGVAYVKQMGKYRAAARDLKRSESKSRSPIYTQFREALSGAETIRSIPSGALTWSNKHRSLADENNSVYYSVKSLDRWLSIRLESLGNTIVFSSAFASIFLTRLGKIKSGSAGWGLTQALSITGLLTWAVRVLTDMETQFMSVVRVNELTDIDTESTATEGLDNEESTQQQAPMTALIESNNTSVLAPGWPWKGHVVFNSVSSRYSPGDPLVLENISLDVPAGTTLGIVGRTGSGKSSLLLTLFRLIEVEGPGSITIDGIDIKSLSPQILRDSISIIPQTPTLFAGTLMYNLDASGKASQEEAWQALHAASPDLARQFKNSAAGLDTMISEGGDNLSLGEKQLICLARALLKRSKILILDEATSSVDTKTDAQVQETIRREFVQKGYTVITIAHRLNTVLGYDKILVLDSGNIVEVGAPSALLRKRGYFRSLYDADRRNRLKGVKQNLVLA